MKVKVSRINSVKGQLLVEFEGSMQKVGKLLSTNMKLIKDKLAGYDVTGIQLAPANIGGYEVCASRSKGCTKACIYVSGRGRFTATQIARIKRKLLFFQYKNTFKSQLIKEITAFVKKCAKNNVKPAIRLNVFSDLPYERIFPELFTMFPQVSYYDYTKIKSRLDKSKLPSNYHLTFSRSEDTSDNEVLEIIKAGFNVAIPFNCKKHQLPKSFLNIPVIDGDLSDIRFLDNQASIVGLSVKGDNDVRKSVDLCNGFIVDVNSPQVTQVKPRFLISLV